MVKIRFNVSEYSRGNQTHHWKAVDENNKKEIDFFENNDGNGDKYGQYPSIQQYLKDEYGIDISLRDDLNGNNPNIDNNTHTAIWLFRDNNGNEVEVIDIPRTIFRVNV